MPPVLGPVSPSPTRLWSCAEASGTAVFPSTNANRLASSPSRNSSMTSGPSPAAAIALSAGARGRDGDSLARGQSVGLDHYRKTEAPERGERVARALHPNIIGRRD